VLVRDAYLRWVADRRGLVVPSLLRDERTVEPEPEPVPLPHADHGTEPERYEDDPTAPTASHAEVTSERRPIS